MICALNRTVIDLEGLLLDQPCFDDDLKESKTSLFPVAQDETVVQIEHNVENDCEPKKECKIEEEEEVEEEEEDDDEQKEDGQDILEAVRKFEEKSRESNEAKESNDEEENAHFKLSGRRTTLKTGKAKRKITACYGN